MAKTTPNIVDLFTTQPLVKACAPMVRYSKLQFRNLVKLYGCDLTFTPMILADSFCQSSKARINEFSTNCDDHPVVAQFAANTVHDFVGASYLAAPYCSGVDLNCGCPQRWAKEQNLGCELLNQPQKIFEMVRECRSRIPKTISVSVKMRLNQDVEDSVELCRQLQRCGVDFVTIHARTVLNNVGPINEAALRLIVDSVDIPIIGNGNLNSYQKCLELQQRTGIKGVMVANAILANPEFFVSGKPSIATVQRWVDICYNTTVEDYSNDCLTIREKPQNLTFQCFHHHLVFMLEKLLLRHERRVFNSLKTFKSVLQFLDDKFQVKPKLMPKHEYIKIKPLKLDYFDRDSMYQQLKSEVQVLESTYGDLTYDYDKTDGRFFSKTKKAVECDWSNLFLEND